MRRTTSDIVDPLRHRCDDVYQGQRCARIGSFSPSLLGGGPWFCWEHARHVHGGDPGGHHRAPADAFARLRDLTKGDAPRGLRPLDIETEWERIAIQDEGSA